MPCVPVSERKQSKLLDHVPTKLLSREYYLLPVYCHKGIFLGSTIEFVNSNN
jgi:hypothetical protein